MAIGRLESSCACEGGWKSASDDTGVLLPALQFALGNRRLPQPDFNNTVLNGHRPDTVEMMKIHQARAKFNRQGTLDKDTNLDALSPYLAHRRGLSHPDKQKDRDKKVLALARFIDVRTTDQPIIRGVEQDARNMARADNATHVVLASQIHSLLGNRPGLIRQLMFEERNGILGGWLPKTKLTIIVAQNNQMQGARGRSTCDNNLIINNDVLWGDVCPCDEHNTFMHELCHILDHGGEKRDGVLPDMGALGGRRFRNARQELYDRYCEDYRREFGVHPEDDPNPPPKSHPWWEKDANGDGLRNYVFFARNKKELKDQKEFVADTVKVFLDDPIKLRGASPALYNVYADYFRLNPASSGSPA